MQLLKGKSKPIITVRSGGFSFHKLNAQNRELRDTYHWMLTLRWPQFALFVFSVYLAINLVFSLCYHLRPGCIGGMPPDSYSNAFFFSVETLATVGYGHMYPNSLYGHIVTTIEIMTGMFGLAIITGLIFIRFSRPIARIVFSRSLVIGPFNGQPALMLRVANMRHQPMAEAEFRVMFMQDEITKEGESQRRFFPLKLQFDRLLMFPAVSTIRHVIDEDSPLHGKTIEDLERADAWISASIVCIDTVIPASVQSYQSYTWENIKFGQRFVEIYKDLPDGNLQVDYGMLHETEAVNA